ncbi:MAG: twin-arginine translocase TatA/TatE family subunit [Anaerolineae bacterium]
MPRLGVPELLIILVIVIAIFGVGKLPQLGGAIGRAIREFREATSTEAGDESSSTAKEKS